MTTFNVSVTLTSSGSNTTQNINTNDTVAVTATSTTAGLTVNASIVSGSATISPSSATSGSVFTITPTGTGTYSALFQASSKNGTETAGVNGTISSTAQAPDLTVSVSDYIAGSTVTSANIVLTGGTNGENYRVIKTTGTDVTVDTITNYNSSSNTTFTFENSELPAEGTTWWYKVQAQRPTSASPPGDGTWQDTNISGTSSFWIRRQNSEPTFSISDNGAYSSTVEILATVTNNSSATVNSVRFRPYLNGTALQAETVVTWTGNGTYNTGLTQPRDISAGNYTYTCRVFTNGVSGGTAVPDDQVGNSSSTSLTYASPAYDPEFLSPDTSITATTNSPIAIGATTHSLTLSNTDGNTIYRARSGSYTGTIVSDDITGNGSDTSVTGGAGTYYITGYLPTTAGGTAAEVNVRTYTVTEQTPAESGTISAGTTATEGDSGLSFTFTITNGSTGTYNWQVTRNSGTAETGGEISSASSGTFTGSSAVRTLTWYNNEIVETSFQGESFTMTLRAGGTVGSGTVLDTHSFTLYDNDLGLSANNVIIEPYATSHTASLTVTSGGGSISARVKDSGGTVRKTFTLVASGADTEVISHVPTGNSDTYTVEVYNGNTWLTGPSYTVTKRTYSINAPASINEGASGTVTVTTTNFGTGTLYWTAGPSSEFSTTQNSVSITSNSGSFTITPSADALTEGAETGTITLYRESTRTNQIASDTFTINDTSTGGGGGGGSSTPGTNTYGLVVYGPDNSTVVFGPNYRVCNIAVLSAFSLAASATADYPCDGAQDANKVAVVVDTGSRLYNELVTVTRQTNNIRLTNTGSSAIGGDILAIRIG